MNATNFQRKIKPYLERYYSELYLEWPIHKLASDSMMHTKSQYYPRTDISVGPFSLKPGRNLEINKQKIHSRLRERLSELEVNDNPRCLLAIEVIFSGSSKHILGDILNASAIGLYGIVVGKPDMMPKILRNMEYIKKLTSLGKIQTPIFQNVLIIDTNSFEELLNH